LSAAPILAALSSSSCAPLQLHSFPTRRSSDLGGTQTLPGERPAGLACGPVVVAVSLGRALHHGLSVTPFGSAFNTRILVTCPRGRVAVPSQPVVVRPAQPFAVLWALTVINVAHAPLPSRSQVWMESLSQIGS